MIFYRVYFGGNPRYIKHHHTRKGVFWLDYARGIDQAQGRKNRSLQLEYWLNKTGFKWDYIVI